MFILGLNAYHADSAACLLQDGELIAAAEEERFRRIKHWAGLPTHAIRYCLAQGEIQGRQIDYIAINRDPRANRWPRLLFLLRQRPDLRLVKAKLRNLLAVQSIGQALRAVLEVDTALPRLAYVEHHRAHLASTYFASDFTEAVCVSIDGCGDFASTAWGMGNGGITTNGYIYFPHSLGIFYSAMTQFLGFNSFGDEYKVMGLAGYGRPSYLSPLHEVVKIQPDGAFRLQLDYFRHHTENVSYRWDNCAPIVGRLYAPALEALLGPARQPQQRLEQKHKDLAASVQALYEEAFFALLNGVHRRQPCPNLALAGGCALNSVANGKIHLQTPFEHIYVPPAAGDAGGAIGAALLVWQKVKARKIPKREALRGSKSLTPPSRVRHVDRILKARHAYAGPQFDDTAIASLLRRRGFPPSPCADDGGNAEFTLTHVRNEMELCARGAQAIAAGKILGWFQGRMEWGPRALGNRSILCDPRRADMKQILNAKIKRRESFRPFAPAILREKVAGWFEQEKDVPFMTSVFQVRLDKRALIPAVTHIDGSGRLQTVHEEMNPLFHRLISDFYRLTSVPLVLNTSFNEQEPIVCRPEEALDCFLRTKMDVLALGGFFIVRGSAITT